MPEEFIREIQKRIKGIPISSGRGNKFGKISFDDLVFIPAQLAKSQMITGACGENDIHKLNKGHLRAINSEIAKIAKIKLISE